MAEQTEQNAVTEEFCYNGESYEDLLKEVLSDLNFSVEKLVFMYFLKFKENLPRKKTRNFSQRREEDIKNMIRGLNLNVENIEKSLTFDSPLETIVRSSVQGYILKPFNEICNRVPEERMSMEEYEGIRERLKDSDLKQVLGYALKAFSTLFPAGESVDPFPTQEKIMELLNKVES